jgi:hypothetical protein
VILFGLRDIGGVNACMSAMEFLNNKGLRIAVYAEKPAYERVKDKFGFTYRGSIDDVLDFVEPSLVVTTCAMKGGNVPIRFTGRAKLRKIPVVLVEDMWSAHIASDWIILPDGVCVVDEFAKSLIQRSWPNFPDSKIHITGAPVFDMPVNFKDGPAKNKLREKLGLNENWPVIFFPGTGLISGMSGIIRMLVEALNELAIPAYLILRDHPSVPAVKSSEYRIELTKLNTVKVEDSSALTSAEVNEGADIVVGTFSTMTVEACYMRKPVLILWSPEIRRTLMEGTNNILSEWPITGFGAAMKAESTAETRECLKKIFAGDTKQMLESQLKHCRTDGLSANRIAETILKYYQ